MITIVDYGMGNLGSVVNMFKKIRVPSMTTSEAAVISQASKIVLPGVGSYGSGMANLAQMGLAAVLTDKVVREKTPILGICLGMQLFTEKGEEGDARGLGWIQGSTVRFRLDGAPQMKVPHMRWNTVARVRDHPIFTDWPEESRFYFVHSYHVLCGDDGDVIGTTEYGYHFTSVIAHDNILGVQFHPEKSHKFGMKLLQNFAEW